MRLIRENCCRFVLSLRLLLSTSPSTVLKSISWLVLLFCKANPRLIALIGRRPVGTFNASRPGANLQPSWTVLFEVSLGHPMPEILVCAYSDGNIPSQCDYLCWQCAVASSLVRLLCLIGALSCCKPELPDPLPLPVARMCSSILDRRLHFPLSVTHLSNFGDGLCDLGCLVSPRSSLPALLSEPL